LEVENSAGIGGSIDGMTKTDWTYDRIVFTDDTMNEYVSANVFYFDSVYGIDPELTTAVSDHYPVWAEFDTSKGDDD